MGVIRNLIEKVVEPQVIKENCISMVQCKVLKQLEFIEQRKFDDEDIQADIEFLKVRTVNTRFKGVTILILDCDHVCKVD